MYITPPSTYPPPLPWQQCSVIVWGWSSIILLFCLVTGSCHVAQASLELGILLLQPSKHWTCGLASLLSDAVLRVWPFRFLCSCCVGASFYLWSKEDCPSLDSWLCSSWRKSWGSIALSLVNAYSWIYIHHFGISSLISKGPRMRIFLDCSVPNWSVCNSKRED